IRSDGVLFREGDWRLRVRFMTDSIARITYTQGREFLNRPSRIVVSSAADGAFEFREEAQRYLLAATSLTVAVNKLTGALSYFNARGELVMREPEEGGRSLTPKGVVRNVFRESVVIATE